MNRHLPHPHLSLHLPRDHREREHLARLALLAVLCAAIPALSLATMLAVL